MAIQLSDRDSTIFRFIEEHQVLLEKHIAWLISCDEKPVLIRDRLRKLFYLDYLLCERHSGKLPWWTTPTKPLVYMLSPMTRQLINVGEAESDLCDNEIQRHLLEVANLRMLFLQNKKEGLINDLDWKTIKRIQLSDHCVDALVHFRRNGVHQRIGLINHPSVPSEELVRDCEATVMQDTADSLWIISRDEMHQRNMQSVLKNCKVANRIAFTTHQEIYKSGVVKAKWQGVNMQYASIMQDTVADIISMPTAMPILPAFS